MIDQLIASLPNSTLMVAVAIFIIAAIESVAVLGLILPGTVMMALVASRAGQLNMNVYVMLLCGAAGATLGDSISYWIGKTQCQRIPRIWPFSRHPSWLARGRMFFDKHGSRSILIGRFVGPVRPLIPMIAGMMRMPQSRFVVVNVISAIGWAPLYMLPGYYAGQHMHLSGPASAWVCCFIAAYLIIGFLLSWGRNALAPGARLYYALERRMRAPSYRRRFWNIFSSPFNGFPLGSAVLLCIALPCLIIWTAIVWEALPLPLGIDTTTRDLFSSVAQLPYATGAAQAASMIGDGAGLCALCAPWIVWWACRRYYALALHWAGAMLAVPIANWGLKHLLNRPRPSSVLHSYSYPSSHTSGATILCCLIATYVMTSLPARLRSGCLWLAVTLATLMGLSRLVYGVHWLSDIVGGVLLGLTLHALFTISYHAFARKDISWKGAGWPITGIAILLTLRIALLPLH